MALTDKLRAIADAIRAKTGKTDGLTLDQMATEIAGIEGGGSGGWDYVAVDGSDVIIGEYTFRGNGNIETVTIPQCNDIGNWAFSDCKNLKEVTVGPPKLVAAGTNMCIECFSRCTALEYVTFGRTEYVGSVAFWGCASLKKAYFDSPKGINTSAFKDCASLTALIIDGESSVCDISFDALDGTPMAEGAGYIYVRESMYESYRTEYESRLDMLAPGYFSVLFRKIEDYPEICG